MDCNFTTIKTCELKDSTFRSRILDFGDFDISDYTFSAVYKAGFDQIISEQEITAVGNILTVPLDAIEGTSNRAKVEVWMYKPGGFKDCVIVFDVVISATGCPADSTVTEGVSVTFGGLKVPVVITQAVYMNVSDEQLDAIAQPALDAAVMATTAAQNADTAAGFATVATQEAVNATGQAIAATAQAENAAENADEAAVEALAAKDAANQAAENALSGIKGEATPATVPSPTGFERWIVHTAGTYTNFSGIVVSAADLDVVAGVANNEVILEVDNGVATKRVRRLKGDAGTANYNTGTLSPTSTDKAETGKTVSDFVAKTKTDYENLVPDNIFMGGIGFFENQPNTAKASGVTLSLENFTNPFSSKSLKGVGIASTANSNFFGFSVDITGKIAEGETLVFKGLVYPTQPGAIIDRRFRDASNVQIGSFPNIMGLVENQWNEIFFEMVVPAGAKFVNIIVRGIPQNEPLYITAWDVAKKPAATTIYPKINVPVSIPSNVKTYYVATNGSDTATGAVLTPLKTIAKAIELLSTVNHGKIVVAGGTYREELNLTSLTSNTLEIVGKVNQTVKIMGSDAITGWSLTSGKTKVYEAVFSATINTSKPFIFEDGRQSMPILPEERHALQKSLTHRLPYSKLSAITFTTDLVTTLNNLESQPGKYYHDVANNKIYIHPTDSNSPLTNGYSYEFAKRGGVIQPTSFADSTLKLTNVGFYFSNTVGASLARFNKVERQYVCMFGAADNGFEEGSANVISYHDEVADCRDGLAGTHAITANNRERPNITYINAWMHDNTDDGSSHHHKGNVKTVGCLAEYNGKSGIAPSNTCQWLDIAGLYRRNGGNPTYPQYGEGVECVNAPISGDNGIGCTFTGMGTVCENNLIGFHTANNASNLMQLFGCVSRNNTNAEYKASQGKIYATDCKAFNSDSAKYKVVTSGEIIVKSASALT